MILAIIVVMALCGVAWALYGLTRLIFAANHRRQHTSASWALAKAATRRQAQLTFWLAVLPTAVGLTWFWWT